MKKKVRKPKKKANNIKPKNKTLFCSPLLSSVNAYHRHKSIVKKNDRPENIKY